MMKILILGGYGFMGKNLNEKLDKSKYLIFNESRKTGCDLTNLQSIKQKLKTINPDIIIFASANVGSINYVSEYSADVINDNSLMYLNLYSAVKEFNKNIIIINPISNCSYPGIIDIQNEENWWDGSVHESVESYGISKKLGFIVSQSYSKQYGIKTINLIIPNAYGPHDYFDENKTHAMNGLILRMLKNKKNGTDKFVVWGSGEPIREWIYMPDVAEIIKTIIEKKLFNLPNPLNLAKEKGLSINDLVQNIKKIMDYDVTIEHDLSKQDGAPIKILGKKQFNLHFPDFKFTNYNEGICETINYYKKNI